MKHLNKYAQYWLDTQPIYSISKWLKGNSDKTFPELWKTAQGTTMFYFLHESSNITNTEAKTIAFDFAQSLKPLFEMAEAVLVFEAIEKAVKEPTEKNYSLLNSLNLKLNTKLSEYVNTCRSLNIDFQTDYYFCNAIHKIALAILVIPSNGETFAVYNLCKAVNIVYNVLAEQEQNLAKSIRKTITAELVMKRIDEKLKKVLIS